MERFRFNRKGGFKPYSFMMVVLLLSIFSVSCQPFDMWRFKELSIVKDGAYNVLHFFGNPVHKTKSQIFNERKLASLDDEREVLLWSERGERDKITPYYAIKDAGSESFHVKRTDYKLHFKGRVVKPKFDPDLKEYEEKEKRVFEFLQSVESGERVFIVQFYTQLLDEYLDQIRSAGGKVIKFFPVNGYMVQMNSSVAIEVYRLPFVRKIEQLTVWDKISLESKEAILSLKKGEKMRFFINLFDFDAKADFLAELKSIGIELNNEDALDVRLSVEELKVVLSCKEVSFIEPWSSVGEDVDTYRIQGGVNDASLLNLSSSINPSGLEDYPSLTGVGVKGHVMEGIYPELEAFKENRYREAPIAIDLDRGSNHGHSTYSILFHSGEGNHRARGILPNAQGHYTHYFEAARFEPGSRERGSRYELLGRLIDEYEIMFQTASWGHELSLDYTGRSSELDHMVFKYDIPITQSQSNSGSQRSRPQAWAKNVISVGAVKHFETFDPSLHRWGGGGSVGPSADGRIKPDLVGYFDNTLVEVRNGDFKQFGGTSGATPAVAGFVGLFIELWTDGFFPSPLKYENGSRFENRPGASLTKAMLINTAKQYPFVGRDHDMSRNHQGWGFPSIKEMIDRKNSFFIINESDPLKNLEKRSYLYEVVDRKDMLKVTMTYRDPAGTPTALLSRVNDLDLKVIAPDGKVYWGNFGLRDGIYSMDSGEPDKIDTVENVFIKNPMKGQWEIEVIASEVNEDNHLETAAVDVDYSLVASTTNFSSAKEPTKIVFSQGVGSDSGVTHMVQPWRDVDGKKFQLEPSEDADSRGVFLQFTKIELKDISNVILRFSTSYKFKGADTGVVEISTNSGEAWKPVIYFDKESEVTRSVSLSLDQYLNECLIDEESQQHKVARATNFQIRFRLTSRLRRVFSSWEVGNIQVLSE